MNIRELLAQRATLEDEARNLHAKAEAENRDFTSEEQTRWDALMGKNGEIEKINARIKRAEALPEESETRSAAPVKPAAAPAYLRNGIGDSFAKRFGAYIRKNDQGAVRDFMDEDGQVVFRASNATDMNIGTAADGGYAVPTGFYNQVIARRDEMDLTAKLQLRNIPGKGTTVNVPLDGEDDGEFISTNEAASFDLDAPAIGQAAMTLVKYSKKILLSVELLRDEDASLMNFIMDFVARGQAKTRNNLLLTEVATNGTNLKTFAGASAIASGEPEAMAYNENLSNYLDDSPSVAWVTRAATYGAIRSLRGSAPLYVEQVIGNSKTPDLLGYPVHFSAKTPAMTTGNKSIFFGNWNYVGVREGDGFTMLRDPYSAAGTGQVALWMYFDVVYKVLQAEAIGYGTQA